MGVIAPIIPLISAAAGIAGTVMSANAAKAGMEAQAASASYQSQVAENNATIQRQNADYAQKTGEAQQMQLAMQERAKAASVKAAISAAGIDVNTGSAADVESAGSALAMLDEQTLSANTAREVYGYKVAETGQTAQSGLYGMQSDYASKAAGPAYFSSLLSGASSVGGNMAKFSNVGGSYSPTGGSDFSFTGTPA